MKTPGSVAWSCMRTRSPRIAPPENGDDGSTARTATETSSAAQQRDELAGERRLPRTGGAGQTDGVGVPTERMAEASDLAGGGAALLDERQQPGQRAAIAVAGGIEKLGRVMAAHGARTLTSQVRLFGDDGR